MMQEAEALQLSTQPMAGIDVTDDNVDDGWGVGGSNPDEAVLFVDF